MWSDKYLNIPWEWKGDSFQGCDCLGIVKLVLKNEKKADIKEDSPNEINAPYNMIERAVKYCDVIEDIKNLNEFDIVFFKINGEVAHMGIMVNKFGRFLHQLEDKVSRISYLHNPYWKKRFYIGVRYNERKA